jgi:hypothetical protein
MKHFFRFSIFRSKISHINYWFVVSVTPYFWPQISLVLKLISHFSGFKPPGTTKIRHAMLLVSNLEPSKRIQVKGIDLTFATENWLKQSLRLDSIKVVDTLDRLDLELEDTVLVVSYDWLTSSNLWRGGFREIRLLASQARRLKLPTWIMFGDTFDPEYLIPSTMLVALTGGATILQSNTKSEGDDFGLVFSSGPHIWTMPRSNLEAFSSQIPWRKRENIVLLATSGEVRRKLFSEVIKSQLTEQKWKVQGTNHQLSWDEYVDLTKKSQISVTTCWLQQQYIVGSKRLKARIAKTTVTHRVWEGFAAGCVVVTNSNSVFDLLGFEAGVHFIELWTDEDLAEEINLPDEITLEKISTAGHELFSKIVREGISA